MDDSRPIFEEPTLDDVFEEPIVRLIMARDGVTRADLEALIGRVRSIHPELGLHSLNECRKQFHGDDWYVGTNDGGGHGELGG